MIYLVQAEEGAVEKTATVETLGIRLVNEVTIEVHFQVVTRVATVQLVVEAVEAVDVVMLMMKMVRSVMVKMGQRMEALAKISVLQAAAATASTASPSHNQPEKHIISARSGTCR